jgi:AsmA protein
MGYVKWAGIALAGAVAAGMGALLLIPRWVDLAPYRAAVETALTQATGRPARVSELRLSLLPWAGVEISGLALASPAGFIEPDVATVPSAELRMRLLPLLRREVHLERVVLHEPHLLLEIAADGRRNWAFAPGRHAERAPGPAASPAPPASTAAALFVSELRLEDGRVTVLDGRSGARREITRIRLSVGEVALDRPIRFTLAAEAHGHPVSAEGSLGPVGPNLGGGAIPAQVSLTVFGELKARLTGTVRNVLVGPVAEATLAVEDLSPRRLMAALGHPLPPGSDPEVWHRASLQASVRAGGGGLRVSDAVMQLDDSRIDLALNAADWGKRGLSVDLHVDQIDLDRYFHPAGEAPASAAPESGPPGSAQRRSAGSLPLPNVNGALAIDRLTIRHLRLEQVAMTFAGSGGILTIDPFAAALYEGSASGRAAFDLQAERPRIRVDATLDRVQVNPLIKDLSGKDILSGRGRAELALSMAGDRLSGIRRTLTGHGRLSVTDGSVTGIDLPEIVRGAGGDAGRRGIDFTELAVPFTVENGRVLITDAVAESRTLKLRGGGQVDLVQETLDLRLEPRMAGEGGVGIVIAGRFTDAEVRPDLEGVARKALRKALNADGDGALRKSEDLLKNLLPKKKRGQGDTE